jgi:hypothetical protein
LLHHSAACPAHSQLAQTRCPAGPATVLGIGHCCRQATVGSNGDSSWCQGRAAAAVCLGWHDAWDISGVLVCLEWSSMDCNCWQ